MNRLLLIVPAGLVAFALTAQGQTNSGEPTGSTLPPAEENPYSLVGRFAPPLATEVLRGAPLEAGSSSRRPVRVLNFFSVFCGACRHASQDIEQIHRAGDARVEVVGITRDSPRVLDKMLPGLNLSYTIGRDVGQTFRDYRVRALPAIFVVDGEGVIRHATVGVVSQGFFRMGPEALPGVRTALRRLLAGGLWG